MGSLKKLSVLALQHNRLNGPIPASLGDLEMLKILNLSVNRLSGFIPARLANIAQLEVLDVRNNTLSGDVPPCKLFSSLLVPLIKWPISNVIVVLCLFCILVLATFLKCL